MPIAPNPELVLEAYRQGIFPMAKNAHTPLVQWICPYQRALLPIKGLHVPKSLRRILKQQPFEIRMNTAFQEVIERCAKKTPKRDETWINKTIIDVFCELHSQGHAHSLECWKDDVLIGGIYGLHIGAVFCGESMFSSVTNASKIALVNLTARLWKAKFQVFDVQFTNPHLEQFGVYEIDHEDYLKLLRQHASSACDFLLPQHNQADLLEEFLKNAAD